MSTIRVYCRWRPSKRPSPYFRIDHDANNVEFSVPADVDRDAINAARGVVQRFKFDEVLDPECTQDEVFSIVARDAVDSALDGFNSTIFAYGQTGSGKTFTITGGAERYQDRGIIPRAVQRVFSAVKDRPNMQYRVYISYLEIYNEVGYDLLDPSAESKALEELPRVTLMEDEEGAVHLRGLSMHPVATEEEALNLLFLGDTNRAIAETPMNQASSRSHCIFTVSLESRKEGSSVIRKSKLHLVDLAGSERVHKTNATGQLFREATHINKSLHFLELVIVALYEARKSGRQHVPYRNSMMTSVLRDSLGGNCKTSMVATINPEPEHTDESISTCRFSQRVARVTNEAHVNEETDPVLLVRALKTRVTDLENELVMARSSAAGEDEDGKHAEGSASVILQDEDKARILAMVRRWVADQDDVPLDLKKLPGGYSGMVHALICLKLAAKGAGPLRTAEQGERGATSSTEHQGDVALLVALRDEVRRLKGIISQKDAEISALIGLGKPVAALQQASVTASPSRPAGAPANVSAPPSQAPAGAFLVLANGKRVSTDTLQDRDASFEVFRGMYPRAGALEDNMALLRATYDRAKAAAERVAAAKAETSKIKAAVEKRRVSRAIETVSAGAAGDLNVGTAPPIEPDAEECKLMSRLEDEKGVYRASFNELRELKADIERIQKTLEQGRLKMQADFEGWYAACTARLACGGTTTTAPSGISKPPLTPSAVTGMTAGSSSSLDQSVNRSNSSTGSANTDADIVAFYKARDELRSLRGQKFPGTGPSSTLIVPI